jgi:hypothetical protein
MLIGRISGQQRLQHLSGIGIVVSFTIMSSEAQAGIAV